MNKHGFLFCCCPAQHYLQKGLGVSAKERGNGREGPMDFLDFCCFLCVLIMFSMGSQHVSELPNVLPNMFPIASHFIPYHLPIVQLLSLI